MMSTALSSFATRAYRKKGERARESALCGGVCQLLSVRDVVHKMVVNCSVGYSSTCAARVKGVRRDVVHNDGLSTAKLVHSSTCAAARVKGARAAVSGSVWLRGVV